MKGLSFRSVFLPFLKEYGAPFIFGSLVFLSFPPFNHGSGWYFALFPLLSFIVYIPLFFYSLKGGLVKGAIYAYLYGIAASLFMYYWIANVVVDDLWPLILAGTFMLTLVMGSMYLVIGILFRFLYSRIRGWSVLVFPFIWVIVEWLRTIGDISFPWAFTGYSMTSILPFAQTASVTGVYGLSWIIIFINLLLYEALFNLRGRRRIIFLVLPFTILGILYSAGLIRINSQSGDKSETISTVVLQTHMNQAEWGDNSIDSLMEITGDMYERALLEYDPDLIVLPESAFFCYLDHEYIRKKEVLSWTRNQDSDLITGTLDFETREGEEGYNVYNSVFFLGSESREFERYYKIRLVPFSEALPFEGAFPILSRVNLGEADFSRGKEETLFSLNSGLKAAPFICYEIIYPGFVRRRIKLGADLIINVTNDGWFGRSPAPFIHEAMARMRCIENGLPMVRSANSGISCSSDAWGRVLEDTRLYDRTIMHTLVPMDNIKTFYARFGNWVVWLSFIVSISLLCGSILRNMLRNRE